jgi:Domain of unknown function (DUF4381)
VLSGPWSVVFATDNGQRTTDQAGFDFPAKQWPNMVARLHVQVADEPDAAGFARVRLTVDVEGPATLEVEATPLGDATDAWKTQRVSAWRIDEGKARWEQSFDLRQIKPGLLPIPALKVRCRENDTAAWEEAEWTDILADLHGLPLPTVPPRAPSVGLWWLWAAAVPIGVVLLGAVVVWRRRRRPAPRLLSHGERALAELQRLEAARPTHNPREFADWAAALSALLRRYVTERFALPALRQTTAEFLKAVQETPAITPAQHDRLRTFLECCDLVKFAAASPSLEESREMVQFVTAFIHDGEKSADLPPGKKSETSSATQGA